ncbi:MAG: membrane dipeptidase [Ruminococcus sp.]|nr:membrane dipeptidase [Ruminococcus sp.]
MQYFDLHCDTLYKAVTDNRSLNDPSCQVSIDRGRNFSRWTQCMAIWIPDDLTPKAQMSLFMNAHKCLIAQSRRHQIPIVIDSSNIRDNEFNLMFTVENGAFLAGDISNVDLLQKHSVRMMTLTWNGKNCIGGGADAPDLGLTEFGRRCIPELEQSSVVIDISHASDRLFNDVANMATKPLVASHSNSRAVCNHRRNITDEQFQIIKQSGGLVGLNFHRDFLSASPDTASVKDLLLHAEHFLSLGGEDVLCIGSDFDGSNIPHDLSGIEKIPILWEEFLKIGYTEQLVQKIMYYNAHNFFSAF